MWAINPISRFTLITPDECTKKIPTSSLDSEKWSAAIELAETRFVEPILGWNLYQAICQAKNVLVDAGNLVTLQAYFTAEYGTDPTTGNPVVQLAVGQTVNAVELATMSAAYVNLWNQCLWNYVFNCVWFVALTENYAQFSSSGIQKNNPLDSAIGSSSSQNVGISLNDLRYLSDRWLLDRINPLQDYLEKWVCINIAQYPLYPQCNCTEKWNYSGGHMVKRTTDFINIYEDEDCDWLSRRSESMPMPVPPPVPNKVPCGISIIIKVSPDGSLKYLLCNLQTIPAEYAESATTLQLLNLVNKQVLPTGALYRGNPVTIGPTNTPSIIGYDQATGTFDRTLQGGWGDGDNFQFLYIENVVS